MTRPDHASAQLRDRLFPFTAFAVGVAFALVLMPDERHDYREIVAAGIVGVGLVALALVSPRLPHAVEIAVPLGYLLFVALLRDGGGGSTSGFGGLFLLPVAWLAFTGRTRALACSVLAMIAAELVPLFLIGAPRYPSSGWRATVVLTSVAAIIGFMIERLAGDARRYTAQLQRQAADLEQAGERLAAHNDRLVEVDRLKDEFLTAVSHELRTPLTSISGYLDMALQPDESPIPPTQHAYLEIVERNVARLTSLVNDLFLLARSQSQLLQLHLAPVDIGELLVEAADTTRPLARAKHIDLQVPAGTAGMTVLCDRRRLGQLLDNLVSNAVKFTPERGRVRLSTHDLGDGTIAVEISDTGIGIAADDLPRIFDRFFRASTATGSEIPGTGLGLAISQVIAQSHGTTIDVESAPGRGTTFRLVLQMAHGASVLEADPGANTAAR